MANKDPEKVCVKAEAVQTQHRKSFLQPSHRDRDTASRALLRALLDQTPPFYQAMAHSAVALGQRASAAWQVTAGLAFTHAYGSAAFY